MTDNDDDLDLDWGDETLEEAEARVAATFHRTNTLPPGAGNYDWDEIRESLRRHRVEKGKEVDPNNLVIQEEMSITEPGHLVELSELPGAALPGLYKRAAAAGWEVRVQKSVTHVPDVLFVNDSEADDGGDGHSRGDIRYEAKDLEHYQLRAEKRAGGAVLAIRTIWETRLKDGKKPTTFVAGWHHDPYFGTEFESKARPHVDKNGDRRGMDVWLDVMMPKPEPKKKEAKA